MYWVLTINSCKSYKKKVIFYEIYERFVIQKLRETYPDLVDKDGCEQKIL
jgi:hypothetical protein